MKGESHSWNARIRRNDGILLESRISALPFDMHDDELIFVILRDRSQEAHEHRYSNLLLGTLAHTTNHDFFEYFARSLAQTINMSFVGINRTVSENISETVAYVKYGVIEENFTYDMTGSPCEVVFTGEVVIVPVDASSRYPALKVLNFEEVQMYLGVPLIDPDGQIIGQIWAMDDTTLHDFDQIIDTLKSYAPLVASELRRRSTEEDSEKMHARLTQAQKLESLGVLAGGIAHDFNNLLTGILGNAELVMEEIPAESHIRRKLDVIRQSSMRAAELCRQMLTYAGQGTKVNVPVAINKLVSEMAQLLDVSISRRATLSLSLDAHLPMIAGDASQLSQIVMNLITNASEALNNNSGHIQLRTGVIYCDREYLSQSLIADQQAVGVYVYLEVADAGMGMDPDIVERMFDPFFTTKFAGRGLGLSAVLGIVRGHGGALRVETNIGVGTTMRVLFPATDLLRDDVTKPRLLNVAALSGKTLVVADDDETVVETVEAILMNAGAEVVTATSGLAAIEVVRKMYLEHRCIDLVIVDLTMPDLGGVDTIEQLLEIDSTIKTIISSGYSEDEVLQQYSEKFGSADGYTFLQKPFFSQHLIKVVCESLTLGICLLYTSPSPRDS